MNVHLLRLYIIFFLLVILMFWFDIKHNNFVFSVLVIIYTLFIQLSYRMHTVINLVLDIVFQFIHDSFIKSTKFIHLLLKIVPD